MGRLGASFTTPTSMSGATSPCSTRHGQNQTGENARRRSRQHNALDGLPFRGPTGQRAFTHTARHSSQCLFGSDDDHRHGHQRQRQRGPHDAARAERGGRERLRKEELVNGATHQIDKKSQTKHAKDNRGHTGQIIHGDAHGADDEALFGIFAQIYCRHHPEGRHRQAHQYGHHKGAENGRKHPPFCIGLTRFLGEKDPGITGQESETLQQGKLIGEIVMHYLAQWQSAFLSGRQTVQQDVFFLMGP